MRALGIAPRVDLAGVGQNLWDHPMLATQWLRTREGSFHRGLRLDRLVPSMLQAQFFGTGFATQLPGIGTAFVDSEAGLDAPDLQYFCGGGGFRAHEWFPRAPSAGARRVRAHILPVAPGKPRASHARLGRSFRQAAHLQQFPRHRARPAGDARGAQIRGGRGRGHRAFAGLAGTRVLPAPEAKSDAELDAHIRTNMATIYHPAGTCRIGADAASVVDPEFRVRGVEGLRVIDASVMPEPMGGNLNAAVIMIAEKAADMIRGLAPLPAAPV